MHKSITAALCIVAASLASSGVRADAEVETAYRQAIYESIGGHMTAIVTIMRNQVHSGDLAFHADGLAGLAEIVPELFAEGSASEKSEALPAIWEDPEGFDEAMTNFVDAADNFAAVAKGGDPAEIGAGLKRLGGACKGCHDNYRAE